MSEYEYQYSRNIHYTVYHFTFPIRECQANLQFYVNFLHAKFTNSDLSNCCLKRNRRGGFHIRPRNCLSFRSGGYGIRPYTRYTNRAINWNLTIARSRGRIAKQTCGCGGIGRLIGFRFQRQKRAGSSPVIRTKKDSQPLGWLSFLKEAGLEPI